MWLGYFLRRLTIARSTVPAIKPMIIDSHGNPGMAGSTSGVDTELVVELVVGVSVGVTVTIDTDVLTTVVVRELVVVIGTVLMLDMVETAVDTEVVATELEVALADVELALVVACCPTTGGLCGSRWNIPASGLVAPAIPAPTAHPSCGLVR